MRLACLCAVGCAALSVIGCDASNDPLVGRWQAIDGVVDILPDGRWMGSYGIQGKWRHTAGDRVTWHLPGGTSKFRIEETESGVELFNLEKDEKMPLTLLERFSGTPVTCVCCRGAGLTPSCHFCNGVGQRYDTMVSRVVPCNACGGSGRPISCPLCKGNGAY